MHAGLVLSAHAHNIEYYGRVKVVNNASGTRLAGSYSQTGMQSPSNQNVRYQYLPSPDLVQRGVLANIYHQEPYIIHPRAYGVLIQPSSNIYRSIDCTMCARGMCSIEL